MSVDRAKLEVSYRGALTAYVEKEDVEHQMLDALEIGRSTLTGGGSLLDPKTATP